MGLGSRVPVVLLLALLLLAGFYTVGVQPDDVRVADAFPAGLIAGAALLLPRGRRLVVVPLTTVIGAGIYLFFGREPVIALVWAFSAGFGAWVVTEVLTERGRHGAVLLTESDLRRFVVAGFAGATVGALCATAAAVFTGYAPWWVTLPGVLAAHLATYLTLLPHFMGRPRFPGLASFGERLVQWFLVIFLTVMAFLPVSEWPSMLFCLFPVLGWSAMRAPMRETLVQVLVITILSHAMTVQGMGPFAAEAGAGADRRDLLMFGFALFICACALTAIPFTLAVGVQRRQAWKAEAEQARVRQLVQSASGVAIIGADSDGHIDLFNPGAEQMLGYAAREVIGLVPSIFHTQREIERLARRFGCRPTFAAVVSRLASSAEHHDVQFLRKDGARLTLQFSISRIHDESGRITGFVSTGEDVTDRVTRQIALEEALAAEQAAVENLREVDQVKDALVSGVSHELRTPITSILGYLEVLEDGGFGDLTPQQQRALGRVKGNSNRLLALIDDLLMLSRIHDGYLDLEHASVDLRQVVEAACASHGPAFTAAGVELTCALPDRTVEVAADADRLTRVLDNLLGNAAKFTDRWGRVDLSLAVQGQAAVIVVRDSGIGIPVAEQERVFDRFFRASGARARETPGSGLGLSIAKALVQSHGGRIDVSSSEGAGATFRVRLPLEGSVPIPEQDRARQRGGGAVA